MAVVKLILGQRTTTLAKDKAWLVTRVPASIRFIFLETLAIICSSELWPKHFEPFSQKFDHESWGGFQHLRNWRPRFNLASELSSHQWRHSQTLDDRCDAQTGSDEWLFYETGSDERRFAQTGKWREDSGGVLPEQQPWVVYLDFLIGDDDLATCSPQE